MYCLVDWQWFIEFETFSILLVMVNFFVQGDFLFFQQLQKQSWQSMTRVLHHYRDIQASTRAIVQWNEHSGLLLSALSLLIGLVGFVIYWNNLSGWLAEHTIEKENLKNLNRTTFMYRKILL